MKKMTVLMAVLLSLAACSTSNKPDTSKTEQAAPAPAVEAKSAQVNEADAIAQQAQKLGQDSVYFDYNQSIVKPAFRDTLKEQAEFIKAHGNDTVTLAGNCDERGSSEYNLALGDRRAVAVSKQLFALGVKKGQIKTVSNGKESPRATCHEEKCWKENRRVDFEHKLN